MLTRIALVTIVAAICLSPRMPLPIAVLGRDFDLRAEDVLLVVFLPLLLRLGMRARSADISILVPFVAYIALSLISSLAGVAFMGLDILRVALYWGKALELFVLLVTIAVMTREEVERQLVVRLLIAFGLLNLVWVLVQVVSGANGALFQITTASSSVRPSLLESYGPGLIGEVSPFATGAFFLMLFLLCVVAASMSTSWLKSMLLLSSGVGFLVAVVLSQSRASLIGAVAGAAGIAIIMRKRGRFGALPVAIMAIGAGLVVLNGALSPRLTPAGGLGSFDYRVENIWGPAIDVLRSSGPLELILGRGAGAMGIVQGLPTEAHNHFLRVLLEFGGLGLFAFSWLILAVLRMVLHGLRDVGRALDQRILVATVGIWIAFFIAAQVQDAYLPVIPADLFWMFVGLSSSVAADGRLRRESVPQKLADVGSRTGGPGSRAIPPNVRGDTPKDGVSD
jgi:hypothetical protein